MRLTQRTDYALRALLFLAERGDDGATASEIAGAHAVSEGHVRKVLHALAGEGFVRSRRGRGGRSWLARPSDAITVGQVVRALEPLELVECFGPSDACALSPGCGLSRVLGASMRAMLERLDAVPLSGLTSRRTRRLATLSA